MNWLSVAFTPLVARLRDDDVSQLLVCHLLSPANTTTAQVVLTIGTDIHGGLILDDVSDLLTFPLVSLQVKFSP